jgi:hypothetical protein
MQLPGFTQGSPSSGQMADFQAELISLADQLFIELATMLQQSNM